MSTCRLEQVLDWLEDELELGQYRREFARAKVDGILLLNLEVGLYMKKSPRLVLASVWTRVVTFLRRALL